MPIDPLEPRDFARVAELAALTGAGFDPATEHARSYARIWVARLEVGHAPTGFVLTWQAADETHLLDLVVAPEARRNGVGRRLLEKVVAEARALSSRVVLLEVRAGNTAARALYHSAGFVESGVRRGYYSDKEEDAVLMCLELRSDSPTPVSST
ncbi:MAG TPA: ribosomal protein S18-alanine N-acetyltransferase [Polyangiaceae bacterium]